MKQYSKKAMPQERTIATYIGAEVNFRWPYHAAVIKQLETRRSRTAAIARVSRGWRSSGVDRHGDVWFAIDASAWQTHGSCLAESAASGVHRAIGSRSRYRSWGRSGTLGKMPGRSALQIEAP
jgi:hypothetical protein